MFSAGTLTRYLLLRHQNLYFGVQLDIQWVAVPSKHVRGMGMIGVLVVGQGMGNIHQIWDRGGLVYITEKYRTTEKLQKFSVT